MAEGMDPPTDLNEPTIFSKILSGDIPSTKVYEDDNTFAFRDINPVAPTHILVIPKRRIVRLAMAEDDDALLMGQMLVTAKKVAKQEGLDGFRIVINDGKEGCQSVYHLHMHVIGGKQLSWPPGV